MIISHRGITDYYPENTLGSIQDTIQDPRYNGIEIDIQLTKDNQWIIYHDENLLRLNSQNISVKNSNYDDFNFINWKGNKFKINKLEDLTRIKTENFVINIEIKPNFADVNKISLINLKNILEKIKVKKFLSSFDHNWLNWISQDLKFSLDFACISQDKLPEIGNFWILDYNFLKKINLIDIIEQNVKLGIYGENIFNKKDYDIISYQIVDNNKTTVYVDGLFDIFTINELKILEKAKSLGDYLVVGIIEKYDVFTNPINKLEDRARIVESIKFVDKVIYPAPFKNSNNGNLDKKFLQINEISKVIGNVSNSNDHYEDAIAIEIYEDFNN